MGAGSAGLAFAIRLAENILPNGRAAIYVWDGRLQRVGLRRRRVAFRASKQPREGCQVRRKQQPCSDQLGHPRLLSLWVMTSCG